VTVLLPVAVGGDIGVYALLRAFHEEYGCRAVVLSAVATRAVRDSSFIDNVVVPGIDDAETLVQALEEIGTAHPGATKVLVTNADWYVEMLVANRARLEAHYLMPFCSPEVLGLVSDKDEFARVCAELSIPTPQSVSVHIPDLAAAEVPSLPIDLAYPLVAKPASSADYHYVEFPGKKKIHHLADRGELDELPAARGPGGHATVQVLDVRVAEADQGLGGDRALVSAPAVDGDLRAFVLGELGGSSGQLVVRNVEVRPGDLTHVGRLHVQEREVLGGEHRGERVRRDVRPVAAVRLHERPVGAAPRGTGRPGPVRCEAPGDNDRDEDDKDPGCEEYPSSDTRP